MADETLNDLDAEQIARTLAIEPATVVGLARTMLRSPSSTIEPSQSRSDAAGRQAVEVLGHRTAGIVSGLSMESTIGQGGMGIVRLATQESLGRKVAVKTLKPDSKSDQATLRLLREAWVTGSLEHPNIVPVYDLGLDDDGSPIIVLKKIEGVEWAELIQNAAVVKQRFGATDLLEYNLRILGQLCNAVSLAHARKIVHRDLKPENVMIGSYGEVYLVDWGIAVSLVPDPNGRLPVVKEVPDIAGTPCYMAPEMVGAVGSISQRTDVYLLGAILHEILTGRPPHGGSFTVIMASIVRSTFTFDASVPSELAAIAQKAMARDPADRFGSADELKKAVDLFLERRGALALVASAEQSLSSMRELVAADGDPDAIYRLGAEARFGFRQAQATADVDQARAGLRSTLETIVRYELDQGSPAAAASALAEIVEPPADLVARVRAAREEEKLRIGNLESIAAQLDPQTGRRTRVAAGLLITGSWVVSPLAGPWIERHYAGELLPRLLYLWIAVLAAFACVVALWGRESLLKTRFNRQAQTVIMISLSVALLLEVACNVMRVPFDAMVVLHNVVWFNGALSMTMFVDRRVWPSAIAYFAGLVASCLYPQWKWYITSIIGVLVVLTVFYAWARLDEDRPAQIRDHIRSRIKTNREARRRRRQ